MEGEKQQAPRVGIEPRIIIHGGAGNISRKGYPADRYRAFRSALLAIIRSTADYMNSPVPDGGSARPSALAVAAHAVVQLEDNALFNAARGAVFTRDGINQLEASVMVSRGAAKRAVGVAGLRHVRNPVLLAARILERGDADLDPAESRHGDAPRLDVPSAQGHSVLWGPAAEQLARSYGLAMVDPAYFFTQQRWDEHIRALRRERRGHGTATWDAAEFLPQGTCGAVALDDQGVVCAATSTGGMTNKLTGRIGDTPIPGAGFWAEEWAEHGDPTAARTPWQMLADAVSRARPGITLSGPLTGLLADCLPTPFAYTPLAPSSSDGPVTITTRAAAVSGTGNGDSFLRTCAARTAVALARYKPAPAAHALAAVAGPHGELQRSAGDRWGRTGEGEGGMVGIECVVERAADDGRLVRAGSHIVMEYNCGGMYRAWIDDEGRAVMSIWSNGSEDCHEP